MEREIQQIEFSIIEFNSSLVIELLIVTTDCKHVTMHITH